jgi:hypothetical protein
MQRVPLGARFDNQSEVDKPLTYRESNPELDNDISTTAVLYLTVPNSGIVNGKIMLFHKGLMYIGTSTGMVERRRMSILMLSELTHYIVLSGTEFREVINEVGDPPPLTPDLLGGGTTTSSTATASTAPAFYPIQANMSYAQVAQQYQPYSQGAGLNGTPRAVMDSMLAGQIDLTLNLDQFTGLITVDGWANYVEVGAESSPASANVLRDLGDRSSPNRDYSQQAGSPPDGPTFSTEELKYTGRSVARDIVTQQIMVKGGTVTAGTWKQQLVENVRQPENTKINGLNGLKLKAEGSRNTNETVAIANFIAPRSGTYWQIWGGIPSDLYGSNAAGAGGGDGASAATAALAAVSNVANNVVGGTQVSQIATGTNNAGLIGNPGGAVAVTQQGNTTGPLFTPTQLTQTGTGGAAVGTGSTTTTPITNPTNINNITQDPAFIQRFIDFLGF